MPPLATLLRADCSHNKDCGLVNVLCPPPTPISCPFCLFSMLDCRHNMITALICVLFYFLVLNFAPILGHLLIYKSFKNHRQNNGCRPSWPPSEQIAPAVKKCGVGPLLWASKSYTHLSILFVFNVGLLSYYDLWSLLSFVFCFIFCFCFIFWFWILRPFLGHLLIYKSFKNRQNNGCPWPPSEQIVILWSLLSFVFCFIFWFWILHPFLAQEGVQNSELLFWSLSLVSPFCSVLILRIYGCAF